MLRSIGSSFVKRIGFKLACWLGIVLDLLAFVLIASMPPRRFVLRREAVA